MAHAPFLRRPDIEKHRRGPALVRQPIREFARRNPLHFGEFMPERLLEQKPVNAAQTEQRKSGHDQTEDDQSTPRISTDNFHW